jgi:hypothetical protein
MKYFAAANAVNYKENPSDEICVQLFLLLVVKVILGED